MAETSTISAVGQHLNLIWTMTWLNFVPRTPREGAKLFWVFAEQAGQLAVMLLLFSLIGRTAGYGINFALFLLSGIAMLHLFNSASGQVAFAVAQIGWGQYIPGAGLFDTAIAAMIFRTVVGLVSTLLLMVGIIWYYDLHNVPHDWIAVFEALGAVILLTFGFGLLRGCSRLFMPVFERIYNICSRVLLFVSGIFYVPSFMPPFVRDLLWWNPLVHGIDWLRVGIYSSYPQVVLSREYILIMGATFTVSGMAIIWRNRHRMLQ